MISLPKAESLLAGSYRADRKRIMFVERYLMPALMIFPAFANSRVLRCAPLVLRAAFWTFVLVPLVI